MDDSYMFYDFEYEGRTLFVEVAKWMHGVYSIEHNFMRYIVGSLHLGQQQKRFGTEKRSK